MERTCTDVFSAPGVGFLVRFSKLRKGRPPLGTLPRTPTWVRILMVSAHYHVGVALRAVRKLPA